MNHYDLTPEEADVFFEEAIELLQALDSDLVTLEYSDDDELVNRIFRAIHTLKGAAGSVGHEPMARLAHAAETVLDKVRKRELVVTTPMVNVMFVVVDDLKRFVDDIVADRSPTKQVESQIQQLMALLEVKQPDQKVLAQIPPLDEEAHQTIEQGLAAGLNLLVVYAEADPESIAPLARLLQLHMEMENLGHVVASVPAVSELEQGEGQHVMVAVLLVELNSSEVETVLRQIADLTDLHTADLTNGVDLILHRQNETSTQNDSALSLEAALAAEDEGDAQKSPTTVRRRTSKTIRTSIERLDNLMNLAGELVTDRNRLFKIYADLDQILEEEHLMALNDTVAHLSAITDQLHDEVVKARMQPIEYVFNKFPRLVRQICQELDKQAELTMTGQDTEVDRSVIEQVSDPLLHLIRNAIDHGIETTEERAKMGKSPVGHLQLSARSEEGNIVITIADDGKGIDADKVKQKAVNLGLLSPEQAEGLSYQEAIDLIFAPGLSTAAAVSDLSGRGVGMDVVRNNIQRLNGSVVVHSAPDEGTTFELRLPLTLAIIPTLLARVREQVFALPLHNVVEILKLDASFINRVRGREVAYIRGEILPLFRLVEVFRFDRNGRLNQNADGESGQEETDKQKGFVVSLNYRDTQFGVVVDELLGKQDVVIKSLGYPLNDIRGISGATLLGDGRIGLIVDIAALMELAVSHYQPAEMAKEEA